MLEEIRCEIGNNIMSNHLKRLMRAPIGTPKTVIRKNYNSSDT